MNNNIIYNNNFINLEDPNNQNKNINSKINKEIIDSPDTTNNFSTISLGNEKPDLNKNNYLIAMFGKFGWICRLCNNFNFEQRNNCKRCKAIKAPKTRDEISKEKEKDKILKKRIKEKKVDWFCPYCSNINFGFRKNCNRCNTERKKEFPLVISLNNKKSNDNNNTISSKNININKDINNNHINYDY